MVLKYTAHHGRPCFRWNALLWFTWTWMLLYGKERGNAAKHVFQREEALIELAVRSEKVDQHW